MHFLRKKVLFRKSHSVSSDRMPSNVSAWSPLTFKKFVCEKHRQHHDVTTKLWHDLVSKWNAK